MSLREKINEKFNLALKDKNKPLISTLRLILAAIKERDIANRTSEKKNEVNDDEIIKVLTKMKKQRRDSADLYKKGGRQELLDLEIDVFRELDETQEEDVDLEEFSDEIEAWIIDELKRIGLDTAKAVLNLDKEDLIKRSDLEEETVDTLLSTLQKEFE